MGFTFKRKSIFVFGLSTAKTGNQHYKAGAFQPIKPLQKLFASQMLQFIDIFHIFELCLCAPISNAKVKNYFNFKNNQNRLVKSLQ